MHDIQMVDLKGQYQKIKTEVDTNILKCIQNSDFINGGSVRTFASNLGKYLGAEKVVTCGNGTDALQIAFMSLNLKPGDEVILPAFTYVATAEVLGLLHLTPVMIDVDPDTFNINPELIEAAITEKTKAIVPVHLFGQCADMTAIMEIARKHRLYVIEDTAQAIGADYISADGARVKAGTIGHIGCTSFFPSKNLGCYGDGGALYTQDKATGEKIAMLANHGQEKKYVHKYIGVNSRLDTIQAAVLDIKLRHLDQYKDARVRAADYYDAALSAVPGLTTPIRIPYSTHVFHQYTLKVSGGKRDALLTYLKSKGIPAMIYYPLPLNAQEAYQKISRIAGSLSVTESLCASVLSLPMHTELTTDQQDYIINTIKEFYFAQA